MTGVSIRIDGAEEVGRRLAETASRLERPRALWEEIGRVGVLQTQQRFETEQAPSGSPWPRSIRVLLEGGKTLSDSGRLRASVTHEASEDGVAIGTNAIQAAIHQFGGVITAKTPLGLMFRIAGQWVRKMSVTIPARPFLGLSVEDEAEMIEIADEYMAATVAGGSGAP